MRTVLVSRPAALVAALLCAALLLTLPPAALAQTPGPVAGRPLFGGLPRRAYLGFTLEGGPGGLVVRKIGRNSAAALAGLSEGDIVVEFDGRPAGDGSALRARLRGLRAGDELRLTVLDSAGGERREIAFAADPPPREGDLDAVVEHSAFRGTAGLMRSVWAFPKRPSSTPRPVVVIVRGVGAPAADAPGANPFRDLAFHLAGQGLVVVRYDAQGVGDSQGGPSAVVDFETEVADLEALLAHVRNEPRVDTSRIVLLAQGTGGGVAAVAASSAQGVAALVVIGTIARPLMEYVVESRRMQLQLAGLPAADVHDLLQRNIATFARLHAGQPLAPDTIGIVEVGGSVMGKLPAFWLQYDAVNWSRVYVGLGIPVMNAIGEFDFVSTLGDHRAIADALRSRGQSEGLLHVLEGVDHDLRLAESREAAFQAFGTTSARPSERAFSRISDWLRDSLRGHAAAGR